MENVSSMAVKIDGIKQNSFICYTKVMFGELPGKLTAPVKIYNERIHFNMNCFIRRGRKKHTDKFTFSLSPNDIEEINIHFGKTPSFVAIETSAKFASVACRRIGKDILVPDSENKRKRYILLSGDKGLKNNSASDIEQCNLIMSVSSWVRVNLLSYNDAVDMILNIGSNLPEWDWNYIQRSITNTTISPLRAPLNQPDSFSFVCNKVKFGKLFGKSIAPVRVNGRRMYFTFNCLVRRFRKRSVEKYTFSVGSSDVSNMMVYVGHIPSFLIVETTKKFADIACNRIGQSVLCPGSPDPKKRYLFLMLDASYNETNEKSEETKQLFVQYVSSWTRLAVLSSSEALETLVNLL